jgi:ribosome-associated protein
MAAELASDRKAANVTIVDLRGRSSIADYFVICSGRSDIQVRAICERINTGLTQAGHRALSQEGVDHGHWGLLDYGSVVVHVFFETTRVHYDLERLWGTAPSWPYAAEAGNG